MSNHTQKGTLSLALASFLCLGGLSLSSAQELESKVEYYNSNTFIEKDKRMTKDLKEVLKNTPIKKLDITVAFNEEKEMLLFSDIDIHASYQIDEIKNISIELNGKKSSLLKHNNLIKKITKRYRLVQKNKADKRIKYLKSILNKDIKNKFIGNFISLKLTREEIIKLMVSDKIDIESIGLKTKYKTQMQDAMSSTNIVPFALNYGYSNTQGDNVVVYFAEGACSNPNFIQNNYIDLSNGNYADHPEAVGGTIRTVAPDSIIYCNDTWRPTNNLNADIESYSIGGSDARTYFYNDDGVFDEHVYYNRANVFIAAGNVYGSGNNRRNVTSPAKGMNVITVGNYEDYSNRVSSGSRHVNPLTKNEKPEIVAPGAYIDVVGDNGKVHGNIYGTSFSSPHAAAFLADSMSHNTFLKNSPPSLVKAYMLAGATNSISDSHFISGSDRANGLGGINFKNALLNSQYLAYWWNEDGDGPFKYQTCYTGWKANLHSNRTINVALSWLLRPLYTSQNQNANYPLGSDYDLYILKPNGQALSGAYSNSRYNPFERVTFNTGNTSGIYTFKVCRAYKRDAYGKFDMGIAVTQR